MDPIMLQKLKDVLARNENIAVVVGKNPTIDEMAAALSLYLSLTDASKKVSIASPSDPIVELSSLVGINKVGKSLDGSDGDLIVSFPYKEGEIDKVSYTIDNGYLNIVVKAGSNGLTFSEAEVKYRRGGAFPTLLFVVGTPRVSDLGELFDPNKLKDTAVVNIDNKGENQGFGDIVLVSQRFSSVSEAVADILTSLQLSLDLDIAQNLMQGISYATNNFQNPQTSVLAFEMVALLLRKGARRNGATQGPIRQSFMGAVQPVVDESDFTLPDTSADQRSESYSPEEMGIKTKGGKNPPPDWLTPKVYRGTNLS